MKEVKLDSWEGFEREVSTIFTEVERRRSQTGMYVSPPLFRGHANESWKLETTLERYSQKQYSITDYYRLMLAVEPAVESLTSKSWNLSHDLNIDESDHGPPPGYDFMIYLRNHGFPSPLLDWSLSPYVAAFFAFHYRPDINDGSVAVYSYIEYYGDGKSGSPNEGMTIGLGPYVATHKRHYTQQSCYTICKKHINGRYIYANHEESFETSEINQDILTKFSIPKIERPNVLSKLDFMNINSYSLFGDEDSLMATLAYREIERKNV